MKSRPIAACLILFAAVSTAMSEDAVRPVPQVIELTVSPAAEPAPALKHRLLPPFLDRHEGNAAALYLRAVLLLEGFEGASVKPGDKLWNDIGDWNVVELEKFPQEEAQKTLDRFSAALVELRMAARCERCDWSIGVRERPNFFATLLPEIQAMRNLLRLVALEARLQIAQGNYDKAIATLQTGFAMSRHNAEHPFLVSSLVGLALAQQMHDQLTTLITAPDSPNLYWALAALPDPLINPRPALELEGNSLLLVFPQLRDVRERELTPDAWRQEFRDALRTTVGLMSLHEPEKEEGLGGLAKELAAAAAIEATLELRYPAARKDLLAWGYDEKWLEKMAKGQAVLIHELEYFERTRDELFKWFDVPYWQAYDGLQQAKAAFEARVAKHEKLKPPMIADMVMPALTNVYIAQTRGDRRLAALQTVEALRMYAADHDGRWPMTLAAEGLLPLPINPYTGKSPDYDAVDDVATLTFHGRGSEADLIYKLRVKK